MLKTLLGHWKTHRKKPSLLPEDGDVHFEDPTKVNPLFEDSDPSISSTDEPTVNSFGETETTPVTERVQTPNHNEEPTVNELVDLAVPTNSGETIEYETKTLNDELKKSELDKIIVESKTNPDSDNADNHASENLEHDNANLLPFEPSARDEEPDIFEESETTLELEQNMRIYQPSTSAISTDRKSSVNGFGADKNGSSAIAEVKKVVEVTEDEVRESKDQLGILKHNIIQSIPAAVQNRNNPSTSKSHPNSELEKPENLRARAIDELIRKFQGKSAEDDKINRTSQSETPQSKRDAVSNSAENDKINSASQSKIAENDKINSTSQSKIVAASSSSENNKIPDNVTKIEQNESPATSKSILKPHTSSKSDLEKESLSNIFRFPPPPPIENLKQESTLHGRILSKKLKSDGPDVSKLSEIEDSSHKSDEDEQGTTRSDSSLDRSRPTLSSKSKSKGNINMTEIDTKTESTENMPEPSVRESFLHSAKHSRMCPKKKLEFEQTEKGSKSDMATRFARATSEKHIEAAAKNTATNLHETEKLVTQPNSSKDGVFAAAVSVLSNSKVNSPKAKTRQSQPLISKDAALEKKDSHSLFSKGITLDKKDSNSAISKNISVDKKDSQSSISKGNALDKKDSQPTFSKDIALDKKDSQPVFPKGINFNKEDSQYLTSGGIALDKKESLVANAKPIVNASHSKESTALASNKPDSPKQKQKSSLSKASGKINFNKDNENPRSHSEDSGITRGDQISSEATQDASPNSPNEKTNSIPNPRKHRKEKKQKSVNKGTCKKCRRSHFDSISMKRNEYDEYYDALTGSHHSHRSKHSDSWTSELSWEEKELLRRLRSHRGTVRSNTPSTRSRLSRNKFKDENQFRRFHKTRRSSDESTLFGSSICSCDECWSKYVRDYAYARTSLRGTSPNPELCTCQNSRHNFLGRRVKFQSETIPEASPSERTTSPASNTDASKQEENTTDDKSSQKSSQLKDSDSVSQNPDGSKQKKLKFSETEYRIMTPWEMEQWDYLVRKQLLKKRRNRARCMGIMALAMVVFVGLVVAILMVYLRRKVL